MTWPFENDTSTIVKKLAKKSLKSERRRNLMVVIAVALAAFLICFTGIVSASLAQIQRNRFTDTYEAVYTGIDEFDIKILKGLPEFARVGEYYMLSQEHSKQGYHASYVYCDSEMMYIARDQIELVKGRLPEKTNEVVVSKYFLSAYGSNAEIGETVTLDTESFHGEYLVVGMIDSMGEKETNTCVFIVSKAALTEWTGFNPTGYRAYVHFKDERQLDKETMTSYCREIADKYDLPPVGMNHNYFVYYSKSIDFAAVGSIAVLVLIGGYVVIQSIFRISINDKIQSYGQLCTIGTTPKQLRHIVKKESQQLSSIGILIGVSLSVCSGFILFPKGFHALYYMITVILTILICWCMVSVSVRRPVKIAASVSPLEAVRFFPEQKKIYNRKKSIKLNPVSMGVANFKRDCKKTISIVTSLSLGGILLLVVASLLLIRSPEQSARQFFSDGDYKIYLDSEQSEIEVMTAGNPLNEELRQELLSIDGITDVITIRQSVYVKYITSASTSGGMCDILNEQNYADVEQALVEGSMPTNQYCIVLDKHVYELFEDMGIGATAELFFGQQSISVTISGLYDARKMTNGHGFLALDSTVLFAPEILFYELLPNIKNFDYSWSIVSDPKKSKSVESGLKEIVSNHSNIGLDTIGEHIKYEKTQNTIVFGSLQVLSWLIFLFGVINLINTTLSNQMSRKRENSILRSIGLTQKQLYQMNIYEGLCYAFFTVSATLILGLPIAVITCRKMSIATFAGKIMPYQFPALEMGLFILVLFGMELILSAWIIYRQKKQSLIEQMRSME